MQTTDEASVACDPAAFREAMANVAASVAVLTVQVGGETRAVTIGSLISLSLDPPLVLFALQRTSSMLAHLERGTFGITVLSDAQQHIAALFATPGRPPVRPDWTCARHGHGVPTLRDGAASMRVETCHTLRTGDHVILVCCVMSISSTARAPLLYHRRAYHAVAGIPYQPRQAA